MGHDFTVRGATVADLAVILRQRRAMFEEMGHRDSEALDAMVASSRAHMRQTLEDGSYRGWLAETPVGEVAGGGGIVITLWPSHPQDAGLRRAEIVNVYTEPAFRRRGIARRLMARMVDWCRTEGLGWVMLHASLEGRPLYEAMGFEPTNEMRLLLRPRSQ
jgi:GNAT superfamily N-acetyltransferase